MPTNAINDTGVKYLYDKLHGEIEPVAEAVSDSEVTIEGNPLSFNTLSSQNAKSTILSVEPIQDLHGYSKPWVGGAGKNLIPMTLDGIKANNTDGTWNGNVYSIGEGTYEILTDANNNVIGIKVNFTNTAGNRDIKLAGYYGSTDTFISSGTYKLNCENITSGVSVQSGYGTTSYTSLSSQTDLTIDATGGFSFVVIRVGANRTVNNVIIKPMIRVSTETDATFAPYTNICPISGRTEIGISGCGKNLWNNDNVSIQSVGPVSNRATYIFDAVGIYTLSTNTSSEVATISWNILDKATGQFINETNQPIRKGFTVTLMENQALVMWGYNGLTVSGFISDMGQPQLEKSNQSSSYEPYTKSTDLTISLGQTVYGGTLDVENGVLVVDRKRINLGSLTWTQVSGGIGRFQSELIGDAKIPSASSEKVNCVCSVFESDCTDNVYTTNGKIGIHTNGMVWVSATNIYSDAATFTTAMDGVDFVYELATPITINLTPHTIKLLEGVNNISTDGDSITLTYRDGKVATLGDLTSAVDSLDSKIDESKILTDTVTGDKYILVVTNGVLSVEQVSN